MSTRKLQYFNQIKAIHATLVTNFISQTDEKLTKNSARKNIPQFIYLDNLKKPIKKQTNSIMATHSYFISETDKFHFLRCNHVFMPFVLGSMKPFFLFLNFSVLFVVFPLEKYFQNYFKLTR